MATLSEIREAVNSARHAGAKEVVLLKCVSSYPARPEQMNLMTIPYLKRIFHCPVGLSDHTLDIAVSIAAVSLGAQVIEKHLTISRRIKTPDSFFSLEPDELKDLVRNIRIAEKAKGRVYCGLTEEEKKSRVFRRSLFCVKDIKMGEPFTLDNLKSIRPADGLKPKYLKLILAKKARRGLKKGTPLKFAYIDGS
jgi:sialic acid synthase SpsE